MENTHKVVARFDQTEEARQAMIGLEMKGIDADAIHIASPSVPTASEGTVRQADIVVMRRLHARTVFGGAIGAIAGAVLVIAALLIIRVDSLGTALVVGGIAGAVGGAFIGGFWGAISRLPANEEALEPAVAKEPATEQVVLEVRLDDPSREEAAVSVLQQHHANRIERESV